VAQQAGRIMLERLKYLAGIHSDFAFETTLASRSFAPFLQRCKSQGYTIVLICLWLPSPELAVQRVALRVKNGGHHIPEDTIRRRYRRSL